MCYGETLNRYRFLYEMSSQLKISKTKGNLDNYILIIMNVLLKIETQWNFIMYNFTVLDQETSKCTVYNINAMWYNIHR